MIDYGKFRSSLKRLREQHDSRLTLDSAVPELILESIAASDIQRFKACYDCLWNVLKRHLMEEPRIADPPNSPKPIFRFANENRLLPSPAEQWLRHADACMDTIAEQTISRRSRWFRARNCEHCERGWRCLRKRTEGCRMRRMARLTPPTCPSWGAR